MVEVARLSTPRIRRQVGESSIHKAKAYTRLQAWSNLRIQGPTIKGECRGTAAMPYRVEVTFDGDDITRADCTCPIGAGGHCKHVAALLLVYREHTDAFAEAEELDRALERRTQGELIALIRRMVRRVPELELLLEVPLPGSAGAAAAGDPEPFRRQARAAFQHAGDDWNAVSLAARELHDIVATGDEFRERGELAAAAAAYRGVAEVALDELDLVHDEDGDLYEVIGSCADGLGRCLESTPWSERSRREELLRALFDLYVIDENHGGLCAGDSIFEVLVRRTTPEERALVAGWVRAAVPRGHEWNDDYRRGQFGDLLLKLEGDTLDDAEYLRVCREMGRTEELVDRLLRLGRRDEALDEFSAASDHRLLALSELFEQHALGDDAERVVRERAGSAKAVFGGAMYDWLRARAESRGDAATARELARRLFDLEPSLARYEVLRRLTPNGDWPALQTEIGRALARAGAHGLLLDIDLSEGEIMRAVERVTAEGSLRHRALDVARSAEKSLPREALELYRSAAEDLIEHRNRGAYQAACEHLLKVRTLYHRLGDDSAWAAYILTLREQHRALRAFRDELDSKKLT
jgi:tetratricopeptide (TPR) repeat protein